MKKRQFVRTIPRASAEPAIRKPKRGKNLRAKKREMNVRAGLINHINT